ncbi:LacI family transcriptional regulator [bacterium]|nr:MAG: LacI family transcriptional regulator [bacterium]
MRSQKRATLKQIALRAGVGTAAASVVLNGSRSTSRVSEANRQAILRAANELNYRPNGLARSLRSSRTGIIGYFTGYDCIDPRNQYVAEVMSGLQAACVSLGLDLLLYTPHTDLTAEKVVSNLCDGRLDGLVITALPDHPIVQMLAEEHLPVVAIADPLPNIPSVVADAREGGRLQARHLHGLGHRRVLYLPSDFPFPSVIERQDGFFEEAAILGMSVVTGGSIHGHHPELRTVKDKAMLMSEADLAHLSGSEKATAVLCWDDAPAYRIATQLAQAGFSVPQDVAVMGFNGCTPAAELRWNLSTVRAPFREMASIAVETLHRLIAQESVPPLQVLPVTLVPGATT